MILFGDWRSHNFEKKVILPKIISFHFNNIAFINIFWYLRMHLNLNKAYFLNSQEYKMFSPFVLKLLSILPVVRYFGGVSLAFNKKDMRFFTTPKAIEKTTKNFKMFLSWIGLSAIILMRYYRNGNFDQLNLALAVWLILVLVCVSYSIVTCFPGDLCLMTNWIFTFYPNLQRKFNNKY